MNLRSHTIVVLAYLLGCAGPRPYGSFLAGQGASLAALAADANAKLVRDYPPERHGVQLVDGGADGFGRALGNVLRRSGYEVREGVHPSANAVPVRYAVDRVKGTGLLRTTLHVGGRQLSRAYAPKADGLRPVGPWSATEAR